jgi:hypothetical protein
MVKLTLIARGFYPFLWVFLPPCQKVLGGLDKTHMKNTSNNMTTENIKKLRFNIFSKILHSSFITLILFSIVLIQAGLTNSFGLTFAFLTILTVLIGIITFILLTRNHRIDFKEKKVLFETKIIEDCFCNVVYETGSATLPDNLLSILFFKTYI